MFSEFDRPVTAEERERLLGWIPEQPLFLRQWGREVLLEAVVVGGILSVLALTGVVAAPVIWISVPVYLLVFWLIPLRRKAIEPWRMHRAASCRLQALRTAVMAAAIVRVQRVEAADVIEICHDEGTIYVFDVGEGRLYWTAPDRPCDRWPNSCFEVVSVPGAVGEFGPFCDGKRLKPLESLDFRDFEFLDLPESGLFSGTLETYIDEAARNRAAAS